MKKIVWMACGMALMCAPLSASANIRYDDPQEEVQKKEVPNPEKAAQRQTDEMDKALNLTEKQYKKIYKLFLKEEKEKVENMMQRHPGGMDGQTPMGGRPPMGGGMQPQVLPPMPEGERPGPGPRGAEEEEAPLLDTAAE
ncbi:hypothetical protein [Phocaeicola plebeius]|uniref:hypothetical protein n=1 Tax=Phocaeicola plebeius TaxID=310297 RepID=UPI00241E43A8|nr:hypothetical protein [Phocaeicola plebeius]MBS5540278.1 hypothetical protein [Phocaeicola plebeius]